MQGKNYFSLLMTVLIVLGFVSTAPVFAQTNQGMGRGLGNGINKTQKPVVSGTVSVISGNTLTITGRQGNSNATKATTYTIDATNAKVTKNNVTSTVASVAVGDTIVAQGTVTGTNVVATTIRDGMMGQNGGQKGEMGISGSVLSINGTTFTITSKWKANKTTNTTTATTYTVDASSATVTKNGAASTVANITVGDMVVVQGTINGTNIVAKTIRDGVGSNNIEGTIQGNGQPVVAGNVTAVNGSSITITNKSNVAYTIDATNAKFVVTGITSPTISNVAVGDNVIVQGAINGNSVVASSVIDQKAKPNSSGEDNSNNKVGFMGGMMNGVGNFFKRLFGF